MRRLCTFLMVTIGWISMATAETPSSPPAPPASPAPPAPLKVQFSIVKTGTAVTKEALAMQGGSLAKGMTLNHSAFLLQHGDDLVLVDTGLGRKIDEQFKADMPFWAKPLFSYKREAPAADQLPSELKSRIKKIVLTHVHWDHASGLEDFLPGACVSVDEEEMVELKDRKRAVTFPSQFSDPNLKWCNYSWSNKPYKGFDRSYDLFGDGSVVAVPLPGHSHGSVGLFIPMKDKTYFLVGDLVWSARAIDLERHKFYVASKIVDRDRDQIMAAIKQVLAEKKKDPNLVIVPAHDAEVQDGLGYFPKWVE